MLSMYYLLQSCLLYNVLLYTEILTLSLHDALPIFPDQTFDCTDVFGKVFNDVNRNGVQNNGEDGLPGVRDRKSTRLNSSHLGSSYAVFCFKKKIHYVLSVLVDTVV